MPPPSFRQRFGRVSLLLLTLGLLGFALGVGYFLRRTLREHPPLVLSLAPADEWEGVSPEQRLGILILLKDHLEVLQGRTVVEEANLEDSIGPQGIRAVLGGKRRGDGLSLELRILGPGSEGERWAGPTGPPNESVLSCLARLGLEPGRKPTILTREPTAFWDLAEATGWRIDRDPAKPLRIAQDLVKREPQSAGAWATLAALTYWQLGREAGRTDTDSFHRCEAIFRQAFALIPHYPRAVDDFVGFKTDIGNPREAMETVFAALKEFPKVAHLHGALSYPARVSGLLEGASRALKARDVLAGPHRFERDQVENTYLYRGDWELFEQTLGPGSDAVNEPGRDFYRGYVNLLRGRTDRARPFFARAQRVKGNWVQFESLARVYELALSNDREHARQELRHIKTERALLRVPDGEFTFKLAEAFAFLGDYDEATETALRAFAQGFACTRWYLESPFLAPVPHQARWISLTQHLKERQQLMEQSFPPRRFGPR